MNLFSVLPDLPIKPFANIVPSLERNEITVADLLTLDASDVAKRAQIPVREVRRLTDAILQSLHAQYGMSNEPLDGGDVDAGLARGATFFRSGLDLVAQWQTISTLDDALDAALGGGIPTGYVTEITGESGVGKTQLLLTLLLSVQLAPPDGLGRSALYISTEAPLQTSRLSQMMSSHPRFSALDCSAQPSLLRILGIQTPDLEYQDHILRYQVPVAIKRDNIGLLVIDSITANYRAELERPNEGGRPGASMAKRSAQLMELGTLLRDLARKENIAVVVANQVADRFQVGYRPERLAQAPVAPSSNPHRDPTAGGFNAGSVSSAYPPHASDPIAVGDERQGEAMGTGSADPFTLDHQQRWFSGWGDKKRRHGEESGLKTPSLGLVWTNQIACRIALHKRRVYKPWAMPDEGNAFQTENSRWSRHLKLVFAPWAAGADGHQGVEFCIEQSGLRPVSKRDKQGDALDRATDDLSTRLPT